MQNVKVTLPNQSFCNHNIRNYKFQCSIYIHNNISNIAGFQSANLLYQSCFPPLQNETFQQTCLQFQSSVRLFPITSHLQPSSHSVYFQFCHPGFGLWSHFHTKVKVTKTVRGLHFQIHGFLSDPDSLPPPPTPVVFGIIPQPSCKICWSRWPLLMKLWWQHSNLTQQRKGYQINNQLHSSGIATQVLSGELECPAHDHRCVKWRISLNDGPSHYTPCKSF